MSRKIKNLIVTLLFIGPALILYTTFFTVPFLNGVYLSLTKWDGVTAPKYVFLENFLVLFRDSEFWLSIQRTLIVVAVNFSLTTIFGMLIAILLSSDNITRLLGRTLVFLPNVISMVHVGFIWKFLLTRVIGSTLLSNPREVLFSVALTLCWQTVGYVMVINLAALSSVNKELVEAAKIDGASDFTAFFKIKLPLMIPVVRVGMFINLIWGLKVFDVVFSLTSGGPGTASEVVMLNIYKEAFVFNNFGYASAKSVFISVIIIILTAFQIKLSKSMVID